MKRSQVLLFIISAIALLAVICAVFPEEGLALGRATLQWPSLTEVLEGDGQDKGPSPEEIVAERNKAARAEKKEEYERYFREDPARFYLPGDDLHFFDRFFAALDNAEKKPVRIVHYGDSQIEELSEKLINPEETSGLVNVTRRLLHYAGGRGELFVKRSDLGGLKVTIYLCSQRED